MWVRASGRVWRGARALGMVPTLERDFHLDIRIEPAENCDHAIEREAPELRIADARKLGMRDAGQLLGFARREFAGVEIANDRGGDERPRLLEAGSGRPKSR